MRDKRWTAAQLEVEGSEEIKCLFNPESFGFTVSNKWTPDKVQAKPTPKLHFAGGNSGTFSLTLMFDTTDDGTPVTDYTNRLVKLMEIDESLPGYDAKRNKGRPPWVKFHWGTHIHTYKSVVQSVDVTFTYFSMEGTPLRAKVTLKLIQLEHAENHPLQNPTSGTPKPNRSHQVQVGETLDRISARYFGDSTRWREIAVMNDISDPLDLTPGTYLSIPGRNR